MKIISLLIIMVITIPGTGRCFSLQGPVKTMESPAYKVRGTEYLPLVLVCDAYGIEWKWDTSSMTADLTKNGARLRMRVGDYRVYANNSISVQERPVIMHRGAVCIPAEFLKTVFGKLFFEKPAESKAISTTPSHYKIKKIVIDPGHGGYDPGAIAKNGMKEKYIALDIANKVAALLEEEGIAVVMTREDDSFIPLWKRVDIANRCGADLFVSIHANASVARRLKGFEVYYLSEDLDDNARAVTMAKEYAMKFDSGSVYRYTDALNEILWDLELTENRRSSVQLGNQVLDNIDVSKRDIKSARFFVLKGARQPAILVEVGYISNRDECSMLGSKEYRTEIAGRITNGISEYKKKFEESDGFSN